MPKEYLWEIQEAERRNRKGCAIGRMVMSCREGIKKEKDRGERWEGD